MKKSGGKRVRAISWLKVAVAEKFGSCVDDWVSSDSLDLECNIILLLPTCIKIKQQHSRHNSIRTAIIVVRMDLDLSFCLYMLECFVCNELILYCSAMLVMAMSLGSSDEW